MENARTLVFIQGCPLPALPNSPICPNVHEPAPTLTPTSASLKKRLMGRIATHLGPGTKRRVRRVKSAQNGRARPPRPTSSHKKVKLHIQRLGTSSRASILSGSRCCTGMDRNTRFDGCHGGRGLMDHSTRTAERSVRTRFVSEHSLSSHEAR